MLTRTIAVATAALLCLAACTDSSSEPTESQAPGALRDVPAEGARMPCTPESPAALALGLPDHVDGKALLESDPAHIEDEEARYVADPRVRQILVDRGLGPDRVTIAQKSTLETIAIADQPIPVLAVAAAQVKDQAADDFSLWVPSFYLLLTSVDVADYDWLGEKPSGAVATIAGHDVRVGDFVRFKVAWYAYGDVVYVVVAQTDQLLEAALRRLPWGSEVT
jgi:hypothetical protein